MNIQWSAGDSRVNCGLCQNLDLASSIMFCSYWLTAGVCLLADACARTCMSWLSSGIGSGVDPGPAAPPCAVCIDRHQTLGDESEVWRPPHTGHAHLRVDENGKKARREKIKRHGRIFHGSSLGFTRAPARPRSWNLLQFPPALFITSRPSSADLRGTWTFLLILPSITLLTLIT